MLITPYNINLKKAVDLSSAQTQALVDFEVTLASLGITVTLDCRQCHGECEGGLTDGGRFSVSCECTDRGYTGDDITAPKAPMMPKMTPRKNPDIKRQKALNRREADTIMSGHHVLKALQITHHMKCMRCMATGEERDQCWGAETNDSRLVIECCCTRRVHDGPVSMRVH